MFWLFKSQNTVKDYQSLYILTTLGYCQYIFAFFFSLITFEYITVSKIVNSIISKL